MRAPFAGPSPVWSRPSDAQFFRRAAGGKLQCRAAPLRAAAGAALPASRSNVASLIGGLQAPLPGRICLELLAPS